MTTFDFSSFPTLTTRRLILRDMRLSDESAVFDIRRDYAVTQYNIGAPYTQHRQAYRLLEGILAEYRTQTALRWGITRPDDDMVIGMLGYNYWIRDDNRASIGFDLHRSFWRQGMMSEALRAILNFGFTHMALNRVEADASIKNVASIKLMQSLGFVVEGCQRQQYRFEDQYHDLVLLGLLHHEWRAQPYASS